MFLSSCVTQTLSVEEAREVAVSMRDRPFIPPPRRAVDILEALERSASIDSKLTRELRDRADRFLPKTKDPATLALFHAERGIAAREIGRSAQALLDLERALSLARDATGNRVPGLSRREYARILTHLGSVELLYGNYLRAISLEERSLVYHADPQACLLLTICYGGTGDFDAMERSAEKGIRLCRQKAGRGDRSPWLIIHSSDMEAERLEARGLFVQAESFRRTSAEKARRAARDDYPRAYLLRRTFLAENLEGHGRHLEAEIELREAFLETLGVCGGESATVGMSAFYLGKNLLSQGRLDEAEEVLRAAVGILERSGLSDDATFVASAKGLLAEILFCRGDLASARALLDQVEKGMVRNRHYYEKRVLRTPSVLITFLETGRVEEAAGWIEGFHREFARFLGPAHELTAVMLGLRGMALARQGKTEQAIEDLSLAVPLMMKEETREDFRRVHAARHIVGAYADLLHRRLEGEGGDASRQAVSERIFEALQGLEASEVQNALGANGARAAAYTPELTDLVRKEQDLSLQIRALQATLADQVAAPDVGRSDGLNALKNTIESLVLARESLQREIGSRFPRYDSFRRAPVLGFEEVQSSLEDCEALIVLAPRWEKTYAWAIPRRGAVRFAAAEIGLRELERRVAELRSTLAPRPEAFGDIPPFDLNAAHDLYVRLLQPIEAGFRSAEHLRVVAGGPLGALPLSVLPTGPHEAARSESLLFARYRRVPWLIRRAPITRLPSVSSLGQVEEVSREEAGRKPLAGFGDPVFSRAQAAGVSDQGRPQEADRKDPARREQIAVRGIRTTGKGELDNDRIGSLRLEDLNRLPDTAEEVREIAVSVGGDPERDVFLGRDASEDRVKTMDLSDRRVIVFASHALVPGDLDGLRQPAIALSSPEVTGGEEDGLLTMEEILRLELNADWVVLSACNTGAARGAGAEALSGLGRAFFYAGTRALLVSMWPVETTSARELTTGVFRNLQATPGLSRAGALQKSVLALLDGAGLKDARTGRVVASCAHPFFWAPFMVVGDGGAR